MKTLGKRLPSLHFIPSAIPLSDMEEWQAEEAFGITEEHDGIWIEKLLLQMLCDLKNDRQRVVLLIMLLRESGYDLDHRSVATALGIDQRWYMRMKRTILELLQKYNIA